MSFSINRGIPPFLDVLQLTLPCQVVEDPKDAEDNLRIERALDPWYDCEKCGSKGSLVDWYYEFPVLWKRMSTRRLQRDMCKKVWGISEPESEPDWVYNQTFESIPLGPYAQEGEAEWQR